MQSLDEAFWAGKRVLVTGHTGFKGSWLAIWLKRLGATVIGYSLSPPTSPSLYELALAADGIESIEGDVRDLERLSQTFARHKPDIVVHMAAQALVHAGYADPMTTYSTNVLGTLAVLEAVRNTPSVRVVIAVTSDKCYENHEWAWGYRENDPMGGHDPYSNSKGCAELLVTSYRNSYFRPIPNGDSPKRLASTRAGNVIGGGDWAKDRLIPDIMKAIMDERPVMIRRPNALRPWQFVLEPLRGYLMLAERLWDKDDGFADGWNFGPDVEQVRPVSWIVHHLSQRWDTEINWVLDEATHPHEAHFLMLDCTKAKTLLGWRPAVDLETTLDWIVEWYRGLASGENMRAITEAQIDQYEAILRAERPTS